MRCPAIVGHPRRPAGFTMIELLVVVVVLALLITLVTMVAGKAIRQQKVRNTQQIMQNVALALEQFAVENPLRAIYDIKDRQTFGKFPPYQLANAGTTGSVAQALERDHSLTPPPGADTPDTIQERLAWDLSGNSGSTPEDWAAIETLPSDIAHPDGHDDIRALYAYLKVYSPESMTLIPETSLKPLYPQLPSEDRAYVNSMGLGAAPGNPGAEDVLGIHDAWGVPLDYMLYVKCECRLPPGGSSLRFVVTERRPVLRSRGIKREVYDAWVQSEPDDPTQRAWRLSPPEKWLFSEELPRPWARLSDSPAYRLGRLPIDVGSPSSGNGWVRAVALRDDYAYRPDGDAEEP